MQTAPASKFPVLSNRIPNSKGRAKRRMMTVLVTLLSSRSKPLKKSRHLWCRSQICCSVLQCVSLCYCVLRWCAVCSVLECVGVCCSAGQIKVCYSLLQCVAVCCKDLQCVAVCCIYIYICIYICISIDMYICIYVYTYFLEIHVYRSLP